MDISHIFFDQKNESHFFSLRALLLKSWWLVQSNATAVQLDSADFQLQIIQKLQSILHSCKPLYEESSGSFRGLMVARLIESRS